MSSEIKKLSKKELRRFGFTTGLIVAVLFGLVLPWLFANDFPRWPWGISLILFLWALVSPLTLKVLYLSWMKVGLVLGWINTRIILTILFCVVFVPVRFMLKMLRKDPMSRAFQKESRGYRVMSKQMTKEHFRRPY